MNFFISHIYQSPNGEWIMQSNDEHQKGVAKLAKSFANDFDLDPWGEVLGMLHDKGKEKKAFQEHIMKSSGYQPQLIISGNKDHAIVGALIAKELYPQYHILIDNILMGHHRGLYDMDECLAKLNAEKIPDDISIPKVDIALNVPHINGNKDVHHLIRMLYSCLVDADYLDTESFMKPEQSCLRQRKWDMKELLSILEQHLADLSASAPKTKVNEIRQYVQQECIKASHHSAGFYSLTVPTGGGKTLASVLWSLHHAVHNNLSHIIIAIPYTSIIEQTAQTLKNIFGEDKVLEHHSNFDYEQIKDPKARMGMKLATENWDYPIIVTTNVQFFESLFSNKPSQCRKIHNVARSVIILDEVQTLPMEFMRPIVDTLGTLHHLFRSSILFTTASQPVLSGLISGANYTANFKALPHVNEIIPHEAQLHDRLRRVRLEFNKTRRTAVDIASSIAQHDRVLCIVNTRKDAKAIFEALPSDAVNIHLSRMMCPAHIKQSLQEVKKLLKADATTRVRVVATQLIEAGVDVDFPVVYRQEAGLDSILQAAGRCNREGKLAVATTHVFALDHPLPSGYIAKSNNARCNMVGDYDWFSQEAMTEYFRQLHSQYDNFDQCDVVRLLYNSQPQFETCAKEFRLIDDKTYPVIINYEKSQVLVESLRSNGPSYRLMRQLAQYSVNVRQRELQQLMQMGAIEEILEGVYYASNQAFYSKEVGLVFDNIWIEENYII